MDMNLDSELSKNTLKDLGVKEEKQLSDYKVIVRITDKQRKPPELEGTKTDERVNWTEEADADGFEDEAQAVLAVIMHLKQTWSSKSYNIEVESCELKKIQKPHIILPE